MLGVSCVTQVREGIRSSDLRQRSKIKDADLYDEQSKIRRVGHIMRINDNRWMKAVSDWISRDVKRTAGRPPTDPMAAENVGKKPFDFNEWRFDAEQHPVFTKELETALKGK
ncbi:unnamed protein product [Angiostrongylus costaricensis]|uniref:PSCyt2 domain-containing protein n=1 Tax=Angiostrongylus costaricensis TaxID=334426 RepID=A0A0R3PBK3_ANGCS|nr:unnamed protein product [Angiostrongylus costaricensis]